MLRGMTLILLVDFMRDKVAELFELEENLVPVMLIALGKKEKDGRPSC